MAAKVIFLTLALCGLVGLSPLYAQNIVAPPRNVDDIFALLDRYTVDPTIAQKGLVSRAARTLPITNDKTELANFYLSRAIANGTLGHGEMYRSDLRLAMENAPPNSQLYYRIRQRIAREEIANGSLVRSLRLFEETVRTMPSNYIAMRMVAHGHLSTIHRELGDYASGRAELAKIEQVIAERKSALELQHVDRAILEGARGDQYEAEGKLVEAERARRLAIKEMDTHIPVNRQRIAAGQFASTEGEAQSAREAFLLSLARNLALQGKLVEAEVVLRDALGEILKRVRRYHPRTGLALRHFADIVLQQGRYREAERLAIAAIDIAQKSGTEELSRSFILVRRTLGAALVGQQLWPRAIAEFEGVAEAIRNDQFLAARYQIGHIDWGLSLVKSDQAQKAVAMLEALTKTTSARLGDAADESAQTRGILAMALSASGDRGRALDEFRKALPVLLTYSSGDGDTENGGVVRVTRLCYILEAYLDLLLGQPNPGMEAISESFRVADAARGSTVQRALLESAARSSISDSALASLAREEQDVRVRLGVLTNLLGRLLSAPAEDQLPKVIAGIRPEIGNLRQQRAKLKADIDKRFPSYANLVDPKPITLEQARAALRPGETLVGTYVGQDKTYVWAIPHQGTPTFAAVPLGDKAITESVAKLRRALDVGNAAISSFPRFDTSEAHRLFNDLLKPVEAGWKDATSLIIVPHRALGQLPFSLLVTAPAEAGAAGGAPFEGYRTVLWLIRRAAVTQLPSVNALTTLRALPAAGNRNEFIGFGDPYFSTAQQAEAAREPRMQVAGLAATLRNLRIDTIALPMASGSDDTPGATLRNAPTVANSSKLAQLQRLPETADEIRDIAQALKADLNRDVFLGVNANEKNVKTMNLADRKVIAFATHGLVPGDLNGLEQPALALTAPDVAGIDGDGLLTMDEILALKLNADWVVLSACNTGAGDDAGSEAISGLGRAFFYAGARSLLVSSWPVETLSAKLLTTELFKRSSENPMLTRAEALRQTILWLMDSAGQKDTSGKLEFTYAHPMFWAPFALIGDGGK